MKNVISTLVLSLGMIFSPDVSGQNTSGAIKGSVVDSKTGEPQPYANVWVDVAGNKIGTQTDFDGKFTIKPLSPGSYNVFISFVGYRTQEITGVQVNPDKITWMKGTKITMTSGAFKETKIEAYRDPLIKPEDPTAMVVLSKELETRTDIKTPARMIANLTSEIQMDDNGRDLIIRGARPDASGYYVDGVKMTSLQGVPGGSIGSVTVYTGGIPAKYGDLTGGVVVVESKSYFDLYRERNNERNK